MAGALALAALPAFAQDSAQTDNGALVPETPLTPEESAILGNALVFDPVALATPPKTPLRIPGTSGTGYDVTRTEKLDGSSTIVVKQPLQTEWSNSVALNWTVKLWRPDARCRHTRHSCRPRGHRSAYRASAAWMRVSSLPMIKANSARPSNNRFRLGTIAVTFQDTYSVTETPSRRPSAPGDIP
jgi:hypothetical protein